MVHFFFASFLQFTDGKNLKAAGDIAGCRRAHFENPAKPRIAPL